jgi:hypothetical protein
LKGVVSYKDTCFFRGLPAPIEMTMSEAEQDTAFPTIFASPDYRVYESHEGTLIRVFSINGKWYVSTNRKLDASNSKWASKHETFGQYFTLAIRELIQDYDDDDCGDDDGKTYKEKILRLNQKNKDFLKKVFDRNLSHENKYMFLLKPSQEERVVCRAEKVPTIYHVGTFDSEDKELDDELLVEGKPVHRPKRVFFNSLQCLRTAMDELDIYSLQGFLIIDRAVSKTYKILHDDYKKKFDLRGNVPSLRFRYLQLRRYSLKEDRAMQEDLADFVALYHFEADETDIENEIFELAVDLHGKYMNAYVHPDKKNNFQELTETEQNFLTKTVHHAYLDSDRRINTTESRINDLLVLVEPHILNKLLIEKRRRG